jgi:hypothetical protein
MLRIPHCLNNPLTDGGKVISPAHRPRSTTQKHYRPYKILGATQPPTSRQGGEIPFHMGLSCRSIKLTSHLCVRPRSKLTLSRMSSRNCVSSTTQTTVNIFLTCHAGNIISLGPLFTFVRCIQKISRALMCVFVLQVRRSVD